MSRRPAGRFSPGQVFVSVAGNGSRHAVRLLMRAESSRFRPGGSCRAARLHRRLFPQGVFHRPALALIGVMQRCVPAYSRCQISRSRISTSTPRPCPSLGRATRGRFRPHQDPRCTVRSLWIAAGPSWRIRSQRFSRSFSRPGRGPCRRQGEGHEPLRGPLGRRGGGRCRASPRFQTPRLAGLAELVRGNLDRPIVARGRCGDYTVAPRQAARQASRSLASSPRASPRPRQVLDFDPPAPTTTLCRRPAPPPPRPGPSARSSVAQIGDRIEIVARGAGGYEDSGHGKTGTESLPK